MSLKETHIILTVVDSRKGTPAISHNCVISTGNVRDVCSCLTHINISSAMITLTCMCSLSIIIPTKIVLSWQMIDPFCNGIRCCWWSKTNFLTPHSSNSSWFRHHQQSRREKSQNSKEPATLLGSPNHDASEVNISLTHMTESSVQY